MIELQFWVNTNFVEYTEEDMKKRVLSEVIPAGLLLVPGEVQGGFHGEVVSYGVCWQCFYVVKACLKALILCWEISLLVALHQHDH